MFDFPNAPTNGQTVVGPGNIYYRWDGTKWVTVAGNTTATVSDTPPSNPTPGMLWWDSLGCQMYVCYSDGTSIQWVVANSGVGSLPDAPTDGGYYARCNSAWTDTRIAPQPNVGRNLLHNSLFNIQQRGAGPFTAASVFTADRWKFIYGLDTGASAQIVALTDAARTAIGDESARYCLQLTTTGNSGATAYTEIIQSIEIVQRLAGKTITISFWASASSAGLKLGLTGYTNYGSGGSPYIGDKLGKAPITLTTSWARYSATFTVPTSIGKTFGTNNDDATVIQFFLSSGSTYFPEIGVQTGTVQLWGMQLEIGSIATPLEKPDPQQDLAKCQRFYQGGTVIMVGYQMAGQSFQAATALATPMRATPTIVNNGAPGNNNLSGFTWFGNATTIWTGGSATGTGTVIISASFTASADL